MNPDRVDKHSDRETLAAVHRRPGLAPLVRYLASIEALVALGEDRLLHHVFELALDEGITLAAIHEVMLQACVFCGFPRTINGFLVLHRCLRERGGDPDVPPPEALLDERAPDEMERMGQELFRVIYRHNHEEVQQSLHLSHPELLRWVVQVVYGKVLSRPGLDSKIRELAAVAALTVLGVYPQLLSHIKGGLNLGAGKDEVEEVILQMEAYAPMEKVDRALRILYLGTRVRDKHDAPPLAKP